MANLYTQKDANVRKTWLLMTVFLVFIVALGWLLSYILQSLVILYVAIALSLVMNFVAYWQSDKIALAMSHAVLAKKFEHLELFRIVENLSITSGLPVPRVYVIPSQQINAFATGRDAKHAAIAVTEGALKKLHKTELEGVIAHELSHVGNRDILISSVVIVLAGLIAIMADWFLRISFFGGMGHRDNNREGGGNTLIMVLGIVAAILAPLAATLIQLAVSRKREYLADQSGVLLTRYPDGLANALRKIAVDQQPLAGASNAMAHLYLSNPFKGKQKASWLSKLFSTHPQIEERIKALVEMNVPQ